MAVIVFAAQPTIYTGNFIFGNSNLRQAGNDDISLVRAMITRFKAQESGRLSLTREGREKLYCIQAVECIARPQPVYTFRRDAGQAGVLNRYILNDYTAEKSFLIDTWQPARGTYSVSMKMSLIVFPRLCFLDIKVYMLPVSILKLYSLYDTFTPAVCSDSKYRRLKRLRFRV